MASIKRSGTGWRAQLCVNRVRESRKFKTKQEASAWVVMRESDLDSGKLPAMTFEHAMKRYARDVSPSHKGEAWEIVRLNALAKYPIAKRQVASLEAKDFAAWRDARLKMVKPATVAREMNILHSILESARTDWGYIKVNPMQDVRWPPKTPSRKRRVSDIEIKKIILAFGVSQLRSVTVTNRVGLAFLLAIETAMRSGEILGLRWRDVFLDRAFVRLPDTKNGDVREVPLSIRAVEIIRSLPRDSETLFGMDKPMRDAIWRKYLPKDIEDLHFHDSRSEAIFRLSKKLDVLELARVIGHRDLNSLLFYYNEEASALAKKLG